jgi:hypothetical protein
MEVLYDIRGRKTFGNRGRKIVQEVGHVLDAYINCVLLKASNTSGRDRVEQRCQTQTHEALGCKKRGKPRPDRIVNGVVVREFRNTVLELDNHSWADLAAGS